MAIIRPQALLSFAVAALVALALAGETHAASPSKYPSANQPVVGPQATLEAVAQGYRGRSTSAVVANYTADYRFHTYGDSLVGFLAGYDREHEAGSLNNIFQGTIRDGVVVRPPADSVGLTLDGFDEGADPEHPDSTQHYRVVVVGRFELGMRFGDERWWTNSRKHVFHMVRGDIAQLVTGQPADPERWYVRRWLEDVTGVLEELKKQHADCGEPEAPVRGHGTASGGMAALAIRPLTNPACAALAVTCDLPGAEPARVEVYDVSGRLVNKRDVKVAQAGRVTIEAGAGAKLLPGVYWVRLGQASRTPSTRMVVVTSSAPAASAASSGSSAKPR
jgi:hypothetical protein